MARVRNSIELAKSSWKVIQADRELLILPVISGIASMVVAASFLTPLVVVGGSDGGGSYITYIVIFVMYVVLAYVTIFFNSALISATHERLSGGDPTLKSALAGARSRAGKILPWAIVSATVSIILRAIEERAGGLGQIVTGLAGVAWAVVTFLVLPVIVIEGIGVTDAIKKSGEMFRRTWGENLAARVGFAVLGLVAVIPGILLIVASSFAGGGVLVAGLVFGVVWLIGVAVVLSAMSVVFQTALYRFAVDGAVASTYFSDETLASAFTPKRGGRTPGFGPGFAG